MELGASAWSVGHANEQIFLNKKLRGHKVEAFQDKQLLDHEIDVGLAAEAAASSNEKLKNQLARGRAQDNQKKLLGGMNQTDIHALM